MLHTSELTYVKLSKTLSAFVSDINFHPGRCSIVVKSSHTGKEVNFKYGSTQIDKDNDITHWVYIPEELLPNVERLVIFND